MNKWSGVIGFSKASEVEPDIWKECYIERKYRGDVVKRYLKYGTGNKVNDDITPTNQISVIADSFLLGNLSIMRYATYMGAKWKITDITPEWPRVTLGLGGLFNGEE